jgi:hypothetical protein
MTDAKEAWLKSFVSGKKWLEELPSKHTQRIMINYFKIYCDAVKLTPDQLLKLKRTPLEFAVMLHNGKALEEINETEAEDLLQTFLYEKHLKPTANLMLRNAVFSFYKWNKRALEKTTASKIKNIPMAKNRNPTLEDIQAMERGFITKRDKALLYFIESTSVRIGTLEKLLWKDLIKTEDFLAEQRKAQNKETPEEKEKDKKLSEAVPFMLELSASILKGAGIGKYKNLKQITFVHSYASKLLEDYKEEATIKGYNITPETSLFISYYQADKENPIGISNKGINQLFDASSLRAWGDLEKKRFSPHDLRSFMQSALESAKVHSSICAPIMGHVVAGVDKFYSSHGKKELLENYASALPFILPKTVPELETELRTTESKFNSQQSQIEELKGLVTQLLNHEKDMNFSTIGTTKDKKESEEILNKREEQFKQIAPEYTHAPEKTKFNNSSFRVADKKAKNQKSPE